jgi:hypothetical protein
MPAVVSGRVHGLGSFRDIRNIRLCWLAGFGYAGLTGTLGTSGAVSFLCRDSTATLASDIPIVPGADGTQITPIIGGNGAWKLLSQFNEIQFHRTHIIAVPVASGGTSQGGAHVLVPRRFSDGPTLNTGTGTSGFHGLGVLLTMEGQKNGPLWEPLVLDATPFFEKGRLPANIVSTGSTWAALLGSSTVGTANQKTMVPGFFIYSGVCDSTFTNKTVSYIYVCAEVSLFDWQGDVSAGYSFGKSPPSVPSSQPAIPTAVSAVGADLKVDVNKGVDSSPLCRPTLTRQIGFEKSLVGAVKDDYVVVAARQVTSNPLIIGTVNAPCVASSIHLATVITCPILVYSARVHPS